MCIDNTSVQVAELSDAVEAAKDRALAEVIGRRRLELGQLQEADMAAAAAEHRILDLLMATPDAADRESLLRDAFTPPSDTDFQVHHVACDYMSSCGDCHTVLQATPLFGVLLA